MNKNEIKYEFKTISVILQDDTIKFEALYETLILEKE